MTWRRATIVLAAALVLPLVLVALIQPSLFWAVRYWAPPARYTMPVPGVAPAQVRSTWNAPRPGGRRHRGADIFAPRGTPVVAATRGVVLRVGTNALGGNVVWVAGEGHAIYYYAHLDDWAPGLRPGQHVVAGDPLGFVGNTGNARTTPSHLHFAIHRLSPFGLFGIDPVPVLAGARVVPRG